MHIALILNNIRSAENVGAIFRTADAAGVKNIYLCGYTPAPLDRFDRPNTKIAKAALGAEKTISWQKVESLRDAIKNLKEKNFFVVAIEQDSESVDYKKIKEKSEEKNIALILGNEVEGLSRGDLAQCDLIAEIPMRGFMVRQAHHPRFVNRGKESLNVSVATGIVLFSII